jgi:hypothetical protein
VITKVLIISIPLEGWPSINSRHRRRLQGQAHRRRRRVPIRTSAAMRSAYESCCPV